jgi:hypothetical protein
MSEVADGSRVCNIAAADQNVGTENRHFVNQILDLSCCRTTSGDENDVRSSLTEHPSSHASSETTSSSDENVGGILAEQLVLLA